MSETYYDLPESDGMSLTPRQGGREIEPRIKERGD